MFYCVGCARFYCIAISELNCLLFFSDWLRLTGAMPQGSWLGPLIFITLIDDLTANCLMHKYVDDTTLTEILNKNQLSCMDVYFSEVLNWSLSNLMNVNFGKTKDMIIGTLCNNPPAILSHNGKAIEQVTVFKLLGVLINSNLKWDNHVNSICGKAASRLFFLKQLKRNSVNNDDLLYFYVTAIRPVLEYACPAWHTSLTQKLSNCIERIQKRALFIIFGLNEYKHLCINHNISTLYDRREFLCKQFFKDMLTTSSCLHYLLPEPRDSSVLNKLRKTNLYTSDIARTDRYKNSFVQYALDNYQ